MITAKLGSPAPSTTGGTRIREIAGTIKALTVDDSECLIGKDAHEAHGYLSIIHTAAGNITSDLDGSPLTHLPIPSLLETMKTALIELESKRCKPEYLKQLQQLVQDLTNALS